jgi:hypothetical protein
MAENTEKKIKITVDANEATDKIKNLKSRIGDLKDNLSVTNILSKGLGGTIKTLGTSFMSLTKAAWSFVATPIGAIITAIVVAAKSLYSLFKNFQPVLDKVEQLFSALSSVGQVLKNTFIGLFTGTKSLKESFSGLGSSMKAAANEAIALTKAEQDLEDQLKINEIRNKEAEAQINKLLVQSKNRSLSEKERTKLIEEAMAIEQKQFEQTKANADEEYDIALRRLINGKRLTKEQIADLKERGIAAAFELQDIAKISDEEIDRLKNAYLQKIEVQNKSTQLVEKAQIRLDQLADKAAADEEKRRSNAAAKKQKDIEDTLKAAEYKNKKELLLLKEQALAEGKSKEELDKLIERKEVEHLTNMIELRKKMGQETLDLEQQLVDKKLGIAKQYQDAINNINKNIIDQEKKTFDDIDSFLDDEMQKEIDANATSNDTEYKASVEKMDKELAYAKELQQKKIDLAKQSVDTINQIDEQATQFRKNLLQNQLNSGKISQEQYDKKIADIEKKAAQRKKAMAIIGVAISTAEAIMNIWAKVQDYTPVAAFKIAQTVAVGALAAAQIAAITSQNINTSAPSIGASASGGSGQSTAPTTSFSFAEAPKTTEQPVVKTYVIAKDVETQRQLDRQTINNGTI